MKKLFETITSTRAAAYLMAAVVFLLLLAAVVPQEGFDTGRIKGSGGIVEALHPAMRALALDRIYSSPIFLVLLVLLSLGILAGSARRLAQLKMMKSPAIRARHLGSVVFHVALVVILAGAMLNRSFNFEGAIGLTEGQVVPDEPGRYAKAAGGSMRAERFGRFEIRLNGIELDHPAGGATTEAADVTVLGGQTMAGATGLVAINQPLHWNGLEFHMGALVGYSPEIVVWDESGEQRFKSFVRVGGHRTGPGEVLHEDLIDSPVAGQKIGIRVHPGFGPDGDTTVELTIREGETELHSATVAVGDTLQVGELRVAVPRLRRWCYIQVVENPWTWLIFTGFWVGLGALGLNAVARVLPAKRSR